MNALEIVHLNKTYKKGFAKVPVLNDLSFSVPKGKISGFIGANGAGKTTLIKCALGFAKFDAGHIKYFGEEGLTNALKKRIGFLPERPYFYEFLTGEEQLKFFASLSGVAVPQERIDQLIKLMDLTHARHRRMSSYSKGMMQKIGIAQALIHNPELIILDEPMSGLDPDGRMNISRLIQEIAAQGTAVFFSSHLLFDAERLCDRVIVINGGRTFFEGDVRELLKDTGRKSLEEVFVTMDKQRLET